MSEMDYDRGKRIVEFRKVQNMSQDELADAVGISRPAMSRIECGGDFKVSNLLNLVSALGITPMSILYDTSDEKRDLLDDIRAELEDMDEVSLRMLLGAIRGAKNIQG